MQQSGTSARDMQQTRELSAEEREARRQEQIKLNQAALRVLEELDQGDPEEQRQRWEALERMLAEEPITFRQPSE